MPLGSIITGKKNRKNVVDFPLLPINSYTVPSFAYICLLFPLISKRKKLYDTIEQSSGRNKMICWECGKKEGTKQFLLKEKAEIVGYDIISKRWYCEECYDRIAQERKDDLKEYLRLKMKMMNERAIKILERQDVDIYEYQEALKVVGQVAEEDPDKFDSSHEMVAAAIIINNEIPVKVHHMIAGYEVDFFIPSLKVVLEIDGELFHRGKAKQEKKRDEKVRTELGAGYEVIRIDTKYIEQNAEILVEALETIRAERQKLRRNNYGMLPDCYK